MGRTLCQFVLLIQFWQFFSGSIAASCDETLAGAKDADYRGCQTTTRSGRTCQKWSETTPHSHSMRKDYPDEGLGDHNYCRNPDGEDTIWCYTSDPSVRWEYCDPVEENTVDSTTFCAHNYQFKEGDINGWGMGGSYEVSNQACADRCTVTSGCNSYQYSGTTRRILVVEDGDNNCAIHEGGEHQITGSTAGNWYMCFQLKSYVRAPEKNAECSNFDLAKITTVEECEDAANALGIKLSSPVEIDDEPYGCVHRNSEKDIIFNGKVDSSTSWEDSQTNNRQQICKPAEKNDNDFLTILSQSGLYILGACCCICLLCCTLYCLCTCCTCCSAAEDTLDAVEDKVENAEMCCEMCCYLLEIAGDNQD